VAALTLGIAAVPLALFASLTPASASDTNVTILISKPDDAARQLESAFAHHHFRIEVAEIPVTVERVGSIVSFSTVGTSSPNAGSVSEVRGLCSDGESGCVVGLVLPLHYSGIVRVTVGSASASKEFPHHSLARTRRLQ
jgi:hypothetical protein